MKLEGTTIIGVRKDGQTVIAGDGQVTQNQQVVMKSNARKVRRVYNDTRFCRLGSRRFYAKRAV